MISSIKAFLRHLAHGIKVVPHENKTPETLPSNDTLEIPQKTLLYIQTDGLGDYIVMRNFFEPLRKKYADYHITFLGRTAYSSFMELDGQYFDEFIALELEQIVDNEKGRPFFAHFTQTRAFEIVIYAAH